MASKGDYAGSASLNAEDSGKLKDKGDQSRGKLENVYGSKNIEGVHMWSFVVQIRDSEFHETVDVDQHKSFSKLDQDIDIVCSELHSLIIHTE